MRNFTLLTSSSLFRILWRIGLPLALLLFITNTPAAQATLLPASPSTATTQSCIPPLCLDWSSTENDTTQSVAWGDYDGDGDLDLAVGNAGNPSVGGGQPNRLYRNDDGVLTASAVWSSTESDDTFSVAWGDVDGDGDLDLAVGNGGNLGGGQPNRLYRNDGGSLTTSAVWSSAESDKTNSVTWGDYDGDGDLDLAASNYGQPNRLYRNDGGVLTTSAVWSSTEVAQSLSAAWGDVDGDDDLDLVVGNFNDLTRLYRNDGGVLTASAVWSSTVVHFTTSVAWGDYDNDGDPDLAVGGWGNPNQLYRNDNGTLTTNAVWSSTEGATTIQVVWGDVDGDGDLDLAVGNAGYGGQGGQPNRLYRNDNGVLTSSAVWTSPESDNSFSVAWGDMDGDGDLDLAVGNYGQPNRLYRNRGGTLTNSAVWSSAESDDTYSVAWGDVDGDGDLDLAVGNFGESLGEPNRLYRNDSGVLTASAVWSSAESDKTFSVAWGDVDGDGDLDLAVGNFQQPNRLYRNDGGTLTASAVWSSTESDQTYSVAWGDVDSDGDLDLAVGNDGPNRLYRNDGGTLTSSAVWSAPGNGTRSVAWGDVDGDGDLDLATGRGGQNQLHRNDSGTLTTTPVWSSAESDDTYSVAWGDVDGDGDLDLAVGNYGTTGQPNRLYHNDGGVLTTSAAWSSTENDRTSSVAWGDADGDGDLDLAVGNGGSLSGQPNRLYRNDGGALTTSAAWSSTENDRTSSVAWGDVDGDGDLDLAVGNYNLFSSPVPNRLYQKNDGGASPTQPFNQLSRVTLIRPGPTHNGDFFSSPTIQSESVLPITYTLADAEGDPIRNVRAFYSPNGSGQWYPAVAANGTLTRNLSTLGALVTQTSLTTTLVSIPDLARITATQLVTFPQVIADVDVRLNLTHTSDNNLVLTLTAPNGYVVRLAGGQGGNGANFNNTIFDDEASTPIISGTAPFTGSYQPEQRLAKLDGLSAKGTWKLSIQDIITNDIGSLLGWGITFTLRSGKVYTYAWDVSQSGFFGQTDNMVFRLEAYPVPFSDTIGITDTYRYTRTIPIYQYPMASATTFPFRVRGTQLRVISGTTPISNALVYRLPTSKLTNASPIADGNGTAYRTDGQGYLQGRGQLNMGDTLFALLPMTWTKSYTLYYTSATPHPTGLTGTLATTSGVQTLTVSSANPLILFNLDVALEWDARNDTRFTDQLKFDLQRASDVLYDVTDGQAALGDLRLFYNKDHWNTAHIRIYATNRLRPFARIGGIAPTLLTDTMTLTSTIHYVPGQVHMGAMWNRYNNPGQTLGDDWPRTLAHELGHYLFYLNDNYLGRDAQGQLGRVNCQGTLMSDLYREDFSELLTTDGWVGDCTRTLAATLTGRNDWQTLLAFYPWLQTPPATNTNPGPTALPLAQLTIQDVLPITSTTALNDTRFFLTQNNARVEPDKQARAFLFKQPQGQGGLIDLGSPVIDQVNARGAEPGDQLCLLEPTANRLGCKLIVPNDNQQLPLYTVPNWQPELIITPINTKTIEVTIGNVPLTLTVMGRFYGAAGQVSGDVAFVTTPQQVYSATFQFTDTRPVLGGQVYVWVASDPITSQRASVAEYTLGGNPLGNALTLGDGGALTLGDGGALTLGDGGALTLGDGGASVKSGDGQVHLYTADTVTFTTGTFYAFQTTTYLPHVPAWLTPVGKGYHLLVSAGAPSLTGSALSLSYSERDLPAGGELGLRVYYSDTVTNSWQAISSTVDADDNMVFAQITAPGLYVLMTAQEIPLYGPGWNLISYPVAGTRPVTEALLSISGYYTTVYGYVVTDTVNPWRIYDVEIAQVSPVLNTLQALAFGQGYWINMKQDATAYFKDSTTRPNPAQPTLTAPPAAYYGLMQNGPGFTAQGGQTVTAWVNAHRCGVGQTRLDQNRVVYLVLVSAVDDTPGCGAPGAIVTFRVNDQPVFPSAQWDTHQAWNIPLTTGWQLYLPTIQR